MTIRGRPRRAVLDAVVAVAAAAGAVCGDAGLTLSKELEMARTGS